MASLNKTNFTLLFLPCFVIELAKFPSFRLKHPLLLTLSFPSLLCRAGYDCGQRHWRRGVDCDRTGRHFLCVEETETSVQQPRAAAGTQRRHRRRHLSGMTSAVIELQTHWHFVIGVWVDWLCDAEICSFNWLVAVM